MISDVKHETKTDVVPSYNCQTFLSMESKQFRINLMFYKNIILPCQCIFKILSFLSFKDEISLLKCGEIANQTIKYKYYKYHNHDESINFANMSLKNDDDDNNVFIAMNCDYKREKTVSEPDVKAKSPLIVDECLFRFCRFKKQINCTRNDCARLIFNLKQLKCDEESDNEYKWHFKASNKKNIWNSFDIELQTTIENDYNNLQSQIVIEVSKHDNDSTTTTPYMIYFDDKKNNEINEQLKNEYKSNGKYDKNEHRLLCYTKWTNAFTQYFYQQNLKTKNYQIIKRVNVKTQNNYNINVESHDIIDNYFGTNDFYSYQTDYNNVR